MSRFAACLIIGLCAVPASAFAQNAESAADRRVEDVISVQRAQIDTRPKECRPESRIPGEIVVCADREANERERLPLRDQTDSALSTRGGVPPTPDVFGLKRMPGGITVKGCFIPPCPPPPMYFFDIAALPEAPAGSDAARIAEGEMEAP